MNIDNTGLTEVVREKFNQDGNKRYERVPYPTLIWPCPVRVKL